MFTLILAFRDVSPSSVAIPPRPFFTNRRSSIAMISVIVKLSWTSATFTFSGVREAAWNARFPATTVASIVVRSRRSWRARKSDACPDPSSFTGVSVNFRARSIAHSTTAAAPSLSGAQSKTDKGSATHPDFSTVSMVISFWNCAFGFRDPFL